MRKFYKNHRPVNLLPLMDVIFLVLAVLFYLLLFMVRHEGISVELPSSITSEPDKKEFISISINQDNQLFVGKTPVQWEQLNYKIQELTADKNRQLVLYIAADKQSKHEYFIRVLDSLRLQGIDDVNIETSHTE